MLPPVDEPAVLRQARFITFDGRISLRTKQQRPDRYRHLEVPFGSEKRIARGTGLSYSAASFGEGVIVQEMGAFNRLLEFQPHGGLITVEGGMTLERLLSWATKRNLYLAVVPGYPLITIGGCIAADVHGKNPSRDGTFSDYVEAITLYHPSIGFRRITRASDPELFASTCGGYGLTGLIVDATIRLVSLPAQHVRIRQVITGSLLESIHMLREDTVADFAYSWHDGSARKGAFGKGVLFFGDWTSTTARVQRPARPGLTAARRASFPLALWNRATIRCANSLFQLIAGQQQSQIKTIYDATFPFARQTLYHRLFGPRGFAEMQILVPDSNAEVFVALLAKLVDEINPHLVMMSVKRFAGTQQSLSMSGIGTLVALDLVRTDATKVFVAEVDKLAMALLAQPSLSKRLEIAGRNCTSIAAVVCVVSTKTSCLRPPPPLSIRAIAPVGPIVQQALRKIR